MIKVKYLHIDERDVVDSGGIAPMELVCNARGGERNREKESNRVRDITIMGESDRMIETVTE